MPPRRHVKSFPAHHPRPAAQHLCCRSRTSKASQHTIPGWLPNTHLPSTHLPRLHVVPGVGGVEVVVLSDAVRQKRGVGWAQLLNAKQPTIRANAGGPHGLRPSSNSSGSSGTNYINRKAAAAAAATGRTATSRNTSSKSSAAGRDAPAVPQLPPLELDFQQQAERVREEGQPLDPCWQRQEGKGRVSEVARLTDTQGA